MDHLLCWALLATRESVCMDGRGMLKRTEFQELSWSGKPVAWRVISVDLGIRQSRLESWFHP